ncbi:Ig-like domain-containing protein [Serratia bockelmannii]|uniref:Ig-like domain-containing protein n=1 Tax=Serratia bockelmannii TaxID=2703793 RepID=UPI003FA73DE1
MNPNKDFPPDELASPAAVSEMGVLAIGNDGQQVMCREMVGDTVRIYGADGKTLIGVGNVDGSGTCCVKLIPAQRCGEVLRVVQMAGEEEIEGLSGVIVAPIGNTPDVPKDLIIGVEGKTLKGLGTPKNSVEVYASNGIDIIGATEQPVAENGVFTLRLSPAQTQGEVLAVLQVSPDGVLGKKGYAYAPDLSVPEPPKDLHVSADGQQLTGKGTAGNGIEIYYNSKLIGGLDEGVQVDTTFSVPLGSPKIHGEELKVVQVSSYNVKSDGAYVYAPNRAPELGEAAAPTDLKISADGTVLTGHGAAGNGINVYGVDGMLLVTDKVNKDGSFSVSLEPAQKSGEVLKVKQVSAKGIEGRSGYVYAPDLREPAAPSRLEVSLDGLWVSGRGSAGNTILVSPEEGDVFLGKGETSANGEFNVHIYPAQTKNDKLQVVQQSPYGVIGPAGDVWVR